MTLHFSLFGYGVSLQFTKKVVFPIDRLGPEISPSMVNNRLVGEQVQPSAARDANEKHLRGAVTAGQ